MKTFNMRIGNLELRIINIQPLEIVEWGDSHCWVIASWHDDRDGCASLNFCGDRPFDAKVDWADFRKLAVAGQEWLDSRGTGGGG